MSAAAETTSPPPAAPTRGRRWRGPVRRWIEEPNPIVLRELRSLFRTRRFVRFLYVSTALIGLVVLMMGGTLAGAALTPAATGRLVFQTFCTAALGLICLVAPAYAATTLTGERESGTYESLILTGLDPARIVWGKFLSAYAAFALVLVALSPIVGVAFLFGGVSPLHVVFGLAALGVALAPAVAFGIAVSARVRSTRLALLLALGTFPPFALIAVSILTAFGELAQNSWGLGMVGPFWFVEALASRFFALDTFLLLVALPLYLAVMATWFFLATAVVGVRPAAEDRSTTFKWWTVAAVVGLVALLFGLSTQVDAPDLPFATIASQSSVAGAILFFAALFMNEPPLPPREPSPSGRGAAWRRRLRALFGPGAAPTTRFGAAAIVAAAFMTAAAVVASRYLTHPSSPDHAKLDLALLCLAAGNAAVGLFALTFGAYLRLRLGSGLAARILTAVTLFVLVTFPMLVTFVSEPNRLSDFDTHVPFLVLCSPIAHFLIASGIVEAARDSWLLLLAIPLVVYGGLSVFFWLAIEARVRRVQAAYDARRAERERRFAEAERPASAPPSVAPEAASGPGDSSE